MKIRPAARRPAGLRRLQGVELGRGRILLGRLVQGGAWNHAKFGCRL